MILQRRAPAKINLFLRVLRKRPDHFHDLETVMVPVSLCDWIQIESKAEPGIELSVQFTGSVASEQNSPKGQEVQTVPTGMDNLVVKVLVAFLDRNDLKAGLKVRLTKSIPAGGGLGGSSSDAAVALTIANEILSTGWTKSQLQDFSAEFGSDIAFFFQHGTALCTGKGEKVVTLNPKCCEWFVIFRPNFGLSTPGVFSRLRLDSEKKSFSDTFVSAIDGRVRREICFQLCNDLSQPASEANDGILEVGRQFSKTYPLASQLSGSGSCYFGVYPNRRVARRAGKLLHNRLKKSGWVCHGI